MARTQQAAMQPPMLVQLNAEQLTGLIEKAVEKAVCKVLTPPEPPQRFAASLAELAAILGKSTSTVWRWKTQGVLDGALHQYGHSIMVDIDKAIENIDSRKPNKKLKK